MRLLNVAAEILNKPKSSFLENYQEDFQEILVDMRWNSADKQARLKNEPMNFRIGRYEGLFFLFTMEKTPFLIITDDMFPIFMHLTTELRRHMEREQMEEKTGWP